jgi:hypothetical protein
MKPNGQGDNGRLALSPGLKYILDGVDGTVPSRLQVAAVQLQCKVISTVSRRR